MEHEITEIKLSDPIVIADVTWDTLKLRQPKLGELKAARKADPDAKEGYIASLISQIAKVPMRAVDMLSYEDFSAVSDFFAKAMASKKE